MGDTSAPRFAEAGEQGGRRGREGQRRSHSQSQSRSQSQLQSRAAMAVQVRAEAEAQAGAGGQANGGVAHSKNFGYPKGCCPVCPPIRQRIYLNRHSEGPYGVGTHIDDGPFGPWILTKTTSESKEERLYYGCKADYIAYCPDAHDTEWSTKHFCKCMRRTMKEKAPLIPICKTWVKANC